MQITAERLQDRLREGALDPCYFLYGDEPLQLTELGDALRARALAEGFTERRVFDIDGQSDWDAVENTGSAMSLFAERRLIEIRFGARKPDKRGSEILERLLERPPGDDVYFISAGALDSKARKTRWFRMLEKGSVCCGTRDPQARQLPVWLRQRAQRHGKRLDADAAELIAARVEGNLLAAAQEVEKLCLLVDDETITAPHVVRAVTDSARFDAFQLSEALIAGDLARSLRVLRGLAETGNELPLITWIVGRELRSLAAMAHELARGGRVSAILDSHRVWSTRKPGFERLLKLHKADICESFVARISTIDMMAKGARSGSPHDELEILLMDICGHRQGAAMMARL